MEYKLRIIDVDSVETVGYSSGPNPIGAFEIGDDYVRKNPDKDYKVIDENTGARLSRSRFIDHDEEIREIAEHEAGGLA